MIKGTHKPKQLEFILVSLAGSIYFLGVLLFPLDGMLVYHKVTPQQYVAGTHFIHLGEERESRVKFLVQGKNVR